MLLTNLAGRGIERGLKLIHPMGEFVRGQPREDIAGLYRLSFNGKNLNDPSRNLEGNIHVRRFDRARSTNGIVGFSMCEDVPGEDCCGRQDDDYHEQRA